MSNITIRDIAKMANVSQTAISFVINGKEGVSAETRERVLKVIEQTGFKPNLHSRRLSMKKSFNIHVGLLQSASPFHNLFYANVLMGILEVSKDSGYNVVFSDSSESAGNNGLLEAINEKNTDGIIFLQAADEALLEKIVERGVPYVIVDAHTENPNHLCVHADYRLSSYIGTKYLLDKGHRKIGFLGNANIPVFYFNTSNGFFDAMREADVSVIPRFILSSAFDEESAYSAMNDMLCSGERPSAMYCAGDVLAIGAMRCAKAHGLRLPEQMSFFGLDDIAISRYFTPSLTTIAINDMEMGREAMRLLERAIRGELCENIIITSDQVIERDSVSAWKGETGI